VDRFRVVDRRTLVRLGPPVAFLLAATVAVLLVRSALHHHSATGTTSPIVVRTRDFVATTVQRSTPPPGRRYYRIQSGDTFSSVALKFNTTVEELQALNPGVDPHVLTVGQRVRVR
jgi:spore germination protein YaaH